MASKTQPSVERYILETEWKECRATVRNIDRILTTLRIYSLAVTAALMGIATSFFVNKRSDAAVIATLATIALVTVVFCLERHYRGFLIITVDRAIALEHRLRIVYKNLNVDLDNVEKIPIDCKDTTNAMISEVIKQKRESYSWLWKEAHRLIYIFLLLSNIALLMFFIYSVFYKL